MIFRHLSERVSNQKKELAHWQRCYRCIWYSRLLIDLTTEFSKMIISQKTGQLLGLEVNLFSNFALSFFNQGRYLQPLTNTCKHLRYGGGDDDDHTRGKVVRSLSQWTRSDRPSHRDRMEGAR